jgi:hypothetical protein
VLISVMDGLSLWTFPARPPQGSVMFDEIASLLWQ